MCLISVCCEAVILIFNITQFFTQHNSMFEDLERITCSPLAVKRQVLRSLPPSLTSSFFLHLVFSLSLFLSEPPSPSSLSEECGRTCYSHACMTCQWQGLPLYPAAPPLSVLPAAGSSWSAHSQKQDLTCVTWRIQVEQIFDLVLIITALLP